MKIGFAGFGCVNQGAYKIICEKCIDVKISAVLVRNPAAYQSQFPALSFTTNLADLQSCEVVLEAISSDSYDIALFCAQNKIHYVTANKALVAAHYAYFTSLPTRFLFEASVMSGTPVINTLLSTFGLKSVRGILNGSCNYILTAQKNGQSQQQAIIIAKQLGILEADPSADLDGLDAARKLLIICKTGGLNVNMQDVKMQSITNQQQTNMNLKQISSYQNGVLSVKVEQISENDSLANINGTMNAVELEFEFIGKITITGCGAGSEQTGFGQVCDLLRIMKGK
ncbi:homoserine_dehydrogenase [Hexamita inflata]|uniref:homoserine dehydrogenase n=1 Tax=Hexamita inflata TaxID=28002 RepID=A0AA86R0F9_9EUKA|nr:homoserine dehydrogenase [Hexamita inflata]